MPVVELSYKRLQKLVGHVTKKQIIEALPFLGLDIESEEKDSIRVEYSPNRPDYSTQYGIALGLQGILGIKLSSITLGIKKSNAYKIDVKPSVSKIRPFVTGIIAKGGRIDETMIKELMGMQEDLHMGIGRRRKKSSIGIHDLDTISFPLVYTTSSKELKFVPLNSSSQMTVSQILSETEVGKNYGNVLNNSKEIPIIKDSTDSVVSFPPIINSAKTTVTTKTKNLFVEVTGINKQDAEDMLAIVATILQTAGFSLEPCTISGAGNSTPLFASKKILLDPILVNQILGLEMNNSKIIMSLKKSRISAVLKGKNIECTIPAYRFDIFGPMDLIEEVALGYGIQNILPVLSPSQTIGGINFQSLQLKSIAKMMTGLGFLEVLNSSLTSNKVLYDMANRKATGVISVLDSKSQEHTLLRDMIIPGMLENISRNIHEPYPQKIFETGTVFSLGNPVSEKINLAALSTHKEASFTEIKSILQSALKTGFGIEAETKTSSHPTFEEGRTASVHVNGKEIGVIGQISSKITDNYKLREPVVGFEIQLSGLIFD